MSPRRAVLTAGLPGDDYIAALTHVEALRRDFHHVASDVWPSEADPAALPDLIASRVSRFGRDALAGVRSEGELRGLLWVRRDGGEVRVHGVAGAPAAARAALALARDALPESRPVGDSVPVTFWTYSAHGPRSVRRDLEAPGWDGLGGNYAPATREALAPLFEEGFRPGTGGQLVLWSGRPGTGKTTCLRALAREWRDWCDAHYVADPDQFFGAHADYMFDVMLGAQDGPPYDEPEPRDERWRLLIFEDTGELLRREAREDVGQALSRFLNATDGLIGQGLRVLVLVTTNEDLGELHPAVVRSGRGASRVEFEPLGWSQANEWREEHGLGKAPANRAGAILADLYAELHGDRVERESERAPIGFAT